ncbi:MAG TPA: type II secretion system protein [Fibrobacteria bacterium]|nr:type II secretion system protein [Fibrobacteria bacterium]
MTGSPAGGPRAAERAARGKNGFTLVETLVALSLVCAVLLPACLWLYQSRASRAAWERFRATQLLEARLNREFLLRRDRDWSEEIPEPGYLRLEIRVVRDGAETRLLGAARDRKGREITRLQAGYFRGAP